MRGEQREGDRFNASRLANIGVPHCADYNCARERRSKALVRAGFGLYFTEEKTLSISFFLFFTAVSISACSDSLRDCC